MVLVVIIKHYTAMASIYFFFCNMSFVFTIFYNKFLYIFYCFQQKEFLEIKQQFFRSSWVVQSAALGCILKELFFLWWFLWWKKYSNAFSLFSNKCFCVQHFNNQRKRMRWQHSVWSHSWPLGVWRPEEAETNNFLPLSRPNWTYCY